jgi:ribosome-associated protein
MKEFLLNGSEHVDLCDLLKLMDLVPHGAAGKNAVASGAVKVDGQVELRKRCKIKSGQVVEYKGTFIKVLQKA